MKARTDRSYGSLARRLNMNTSTLHRYCAGEAVPQDFAPVERLAAFCAATPQERLELHRLWLLAVAARQRTRPAAAAEGDDIGVSAGVDAGVGVGLGEEQPANAADDTPDTAPDDPADVTPDGTTAPQPPPPPHPAFHP